MTPDLDLCAVCHQPLEDEEPATDEYGEPVAHILCAAGDWDSDQRRERR